MEEENNLQLTADSLKCLEEFVNMAKDYSNPCELKPKEKFDSGLFARTYTLLYDNEAASGAFHNYCCSAIEGFIKTHFSYLEQRDSKEILEKFLETFKSFSTFSRLWSNALAHVDNMYIRFLNRGKTTTVKSMELFNTLIFEKFSGFIVENLINAINELRESESVQTDMIRDVISIFITCGTRNPITLIGDDDNTTKWGGEVDLRLYKEEFLKPFLSRTRLYYTNKFAELWKTCDFLEFIHEFRRIQIKERYIVESILDKSSHCEVMTELLFIVSKNEFIKTQIRQEASNLRQLIFDQKFVEIEDIIQFCQEISVGIRELSSELRLMITSDLEKVFNDNNDSNDSVNLTDALVNYRFQIHQFIEEKLLGAKFFLKAKQSCFEEKLRSCYKTEWLASYCDNFFTKEVKKYDDMEITMHLENIIDLLKLIDDREHFLAYYFYYQYNRMLAQTYSNYYAEREMVDKLTEQLGETSMKRISKLLIDIELSQDLQDEFCKSEICEDALPFDMSTVVLSSTILEKAQERYQDECLVIPTELELCKKVYEHFYKSKYSQRKLQWIYTRGEIVMETKFTPHPYTLNVNCYQASILCQFEAHESLTVEELQRLTFMDRSVLVKQLKHLCNPKKNLLCSKYKSHPLFLDPDIITINLKFSHPLLKINYIPKIAPKIKENRQEIHEEVKPLKEELEMADIKQTKALIVHMMKKRKVMHQKDIVYKMMRKRAKLRRSEKMILGCIEQLAEAEYMAYMDESRENYKYMP